MSKDLRDFRRQFYTPYYCEETVWHLIEYLGPASKTAVFLSNLEETCPIWRQRASESDRHPVVWDYHVVLLERGEDEWILYDLDSTLPCPCVAERWLSASFPVRLPPPLSPVFRLVEAGEFLVRFSSDRSHMRTADGSWLAPPPPRPPIHAPGQEPNLHRFIDMRDSFLGEVVSLQEFKALIET